MEGESLDRRKTAYSATKNKQFIMEVLKTNVENLPATNGKRKVVEIASGTGEHAAYFMENISGLYYQPSEIDISCMSLSLRDRTI